MKVAEKLGEKIVMRIKLQNNGERSVCPSGKHNAVCINVCDLGLQPGYDGGAPRQKLAFLFETETRSEEGDYAGRRYLVSRIVTASTSHKGKLVEFLSSWRGHDLTEMEE